MTRSVSFLMRGVAGLSLCASLTLAHSTPITISNASYRLETIGINTVDVSTIGAAGGRVSTLFIAGTTPGPAAGTTASANFSGNGTYGPNPYGPSQWTRRSLDPTGLQLQALTVDFQNGGDVAQFVGRDLTNVAALPLALNLNADPIAGGAFGPLISWVLPSSPGDIDLIELVYYNDDTDSEVGSRTYLSSSATSFDIPDVIPTGFHLTVNVRLVDLAEDTAGYSPGNILRESRAYINYAAPAANVPEPASLALAGLALAGVALSRRRRQ